MRTSYLSAMHLPTLIQWLQEHPNASICVGQTNIGFSELCSAVISATDSPQFIEGGRINIGFTDEEKRMDAIFLDGYLRGRQWTMNEALAKRVEIMELHGDIAVLQKKLHSEVAKVNETAKELANWGRNQREMYEDLVATLFIERLEVKGFENIDTLPKKYRKLPYHINATVGAVDAVEWDAVVTCQKGCDEFLFLVEAKRTNCLEGMLNLPDRLQRTWHFITNCVQQKSKHDNRSFIWANYRSRRARCVLAAEQIPVEAMDMAKREKYITMQLNGDSLNYIDWD